MSSSSSLTASRRSTRRTPSSDNPKLTTKVSIHEQQQALEARRPSPRSDMHASEPDPNSIDAPHEYHRPHTSAMQSSVDSARVATVTDPDVDPSSGFDTSGHHGESTLGINDSRPGSVPRSPDVEQQDIPARVAVDSSGPALPDRTSSIEHPPSSDPTARQSSPAVAHRLSPQPFHSMTAHLDMNQPATDTAPAASFDSHMGLPTPSSFLPTAPSMALLCGLMQ